MLKTQICVTRPQCVKILVTKPKGKRPVGPVRRIDGRTILKWMLKK